MENPSLCRRGNPSLCRRGKQSVRLSAYRTPTLRGEPGGSPEPTLRKLVCIQRDTSAASDAENRPLILRPLRSLRHCHPQEFPVGHRWSRSGGFVDFSQPGRVVTPPQREKPTLAPVSRWILDKSLSDTSCKVCMSSKDRKRELGFSEKLPFRNFLGTKKSRSKVKREKGPASSRRPWVRCRAMPDPVLGMFTEKVPLTETFAANSDRRHKTGGGCQYGCREYALSLELQQFLWASECGSRQVST